MLGLVFIEVPGATPKKPALRVDRAEPAVGADVQPGDVVAERPDLVAGQGRFQHGQVRLAAGGGEGRRDVRDLALGVLDAHDDHVLGQPALALAQARGDSQGEALLAQQGVAAVAGADAPDEALLREVHDEAPVRVEIADRMHALDEVVGVADLVQDLLAHAGHDPHAHGDVGDVGDLDAGLGVGRIGVAHHVGQDVHRLAAHAAVGQLRRASLSPRPGPSSCCSGRPGPSRDGRRRSTAPCGRRPSGGCGADTPWARPSD